MGMFDYIYYKQKEYQTKDFGCLLDKFEIKNNRLYHEKGHFELIPEDRRTHKWHIMQWISEGWEDINYHGLFNFYDYNVKTQISTEFNAKFTDGELISINKKIKKIRSNK